ncbi:putative aldehyde dehydrogenase [Actinacidiphila reveromycinica]|uniref:Putative aldehyde dehydrogenase n=1 Tax=Actinacidiphila reveromycinica TaxID=659352 RepID=G1UDU4_9ACTN|nr:aldehyde dehydrogenase [Streptomyces sp. SN-593]BAK64640.1 putative aldehyde dehydrogenase [Streptomyces sp. SN-593]BBB01297.1 putative aldehyde dehydrogenase [Streptomyces sp. SN-593]
MPIDHHHFYIGGDRVAPGTGHRIQVHAAATGELVGSVPEAHPADVDAAVAAARAAFDDPSGWRQWTPQARAETLTRFAAALKERAPEIARLVSVQNGMPISLAGLLEGTAPSALLRYYAAVAAAKTGDDRRPGLFGGHAVVVPEPVGVVAAIVPWNVPQGITFMKLAPALAAGCSVVLKPSPETVLDAYQVAEAAAEAGLPAGLLNIVPGGAETGRYLVGHPGVDKVSFTGSTATGRSIAETCGRLLRPVSLELGGKSAAVVLDDADLSGVMDRFFRATLLNNGQVCWLGTRILAPRSRYAELVDAVTEMARALKVGDPLDPATQLGPLVSERQRDRVESYIAKGVSDGARLTVGGGRPAWADRGWYVDATVFADVDNRSAIAQEEIFGPVLSVIPYTDEDEALALANDSDYGLGGSVWTTDADRGLDFARRVQTGSIGVNSYANDPVAPFGGRKASGLGYELGPEGLAQYQVLKSIYVDQQV